MSTPEFSPSWTRDDQQYLDHLAECTDPAWMGELATRVNAYLAELRSLLVSEREARETMVACLQRIAGLNVTPLHSADDAFKAAQIYARNELLRLKLFASGSSSSGTPQESPKTKSVSVSSSPRTSELEEDNRPSRWFTVVGEPHANEHLVEGKSDTTLCGKAVGERWFRARGLFSDTHLPKGPLCNACRAASTAKGEQV